MKRYPVRTIRIGECTLGGRVITTDPFASVHA
jgi:hypothetical protein